MNYYIQAEIGIRWGHDMRWTWRSEYIRELLAGVSGTQADRLTHLSTEDRHFPHLCKLKSSREGFGVNGECLELFLYTRTFTSALIWEPRHTISAGNNISLIMRFLHYCSTCCLLSISCSKMFVKALWVIVLLGIFFDRLLDIANKGLPE